MPDPLKPGVADGRASSEGSGLPEGETPQSGTLGRAGNPDCAGPTSELHATREAVEAALWASLRELQEKQHTLTQTIAQLKLVTDALPVLVSYIDKTQCYQFVSAAYERWFGSVPIVGRQMIDVLGYDAYATIQGRVLRALAGETVRYEGQVPYRGGTRYVDATYIPHVTSDGSVAGFVALVADVSEKKHLERLNASAANRADRLLKITAAVADAVTTDEVFQAVVDRVAEATSASSAALWLVDPDATNAHLAHALGYATQARQSLEVLSLNEGPALPAKDSMCRGEAIFLPTKRDLIQAYPDLTALATQPSYRLACLPLLTRGRVLGTLAFTYQEEGDCSSDERAFLLLVARYAGQAIERLRLLEREKEARALASAAARRLGVLSHASQVFMDPSLDLDTRLKSIVVEIGQALSSTVGISLLRPDGLLHTNVVHHPIPEAEQLLTEVGKRFPLRPGESGLTGQVAVTGESVLIEELAPETLRARAAAPYRDFLERFPAYGMMCAALRSRGRIIGSVMVGRLTPNEPFSPDDLRLLEELAERAVNAIENSQLYEESKVAQLRAEQLYGFAQAVAIADKLELVYAAAITAIETTLHASRSAILQLDHEGVMRFRAWSKLSDAYRAAVDGHSPWSNDNKAPEPVLVFDTRTDPATSALLPMLEREGIRALAFIPLSLDGRLLGKFMVYYDTPHVFVADEIETARAIANHLSSVIARFQAVGALHDTIRSNELFAGVLAHDLRNPLNAIMTAAQFLLMQREGEATQAAESRPLGRILSSGQRMTTMIDQLLDFTRARSGGGISVEPQLTNLEELCIQAIEELELTHPEWSIQCRSHGYLRGAWDPDRLLQVISNLVANAGHHGRPGTAVTVTLNGSEDDYVRVAVHNHGVIPAPLLPNLFDPFRTARQRANPTRGVGLGLYIVQEIARAHGGSVDVTSEETSGTTFTLRLPRYSTRQSPLP